MNKKIREEEEQTIYCLSWSKVFGCKTPCLEYQCNKYTPVSLPIHPEDPNSKMEDQYFCAEQMQMNALQAIVMELIYLNETMDEISEATRVEAGIIEQPEEDLKKKERDVNEVLFG
jgi:hypothetical protein